VSCRELAPPFGHHAESHVSLFDVSQQTSSLRSSTAVHCSVTVAVLARRAVRRASACYRVARFSTVKLHHVPVSACTLPTARKCANHSPAPFT